MSAAPRGCYKLLSTGTTTCPPEKAGTPPSAAVTPATPDRISSPPVKELEPIWRYQSKPPMARSSFAPGWAHSADANDHH